MNPLQLNRAYRLRLISLGYAYLKYKQSKKVKRRRRYWVHPILTKRSTLGAWNTCMTEMRNLYPEKHRQAFRMDVEHFQEVLSLVKDRITKNDTLFRKAIVPEQRLAVTLYYLSTGDSFSTIALLFRLGASTVRSIIFETCSAIWDEMKGQYLKTPDTEEEWRAVARLWANLELPSLSWCYWWQTLLHPVPPKHWIWILQLQKVLQYSFTRSMWC